MSESITMKPAKELRISVVDNHIVRNYMAAIVGGLQLDPVMIRGTRVIDGNHRAAAYKLLGMDIPTIPA
jgi:ParB-like chromosome segregation protein Spo0J